MYPTAAIFMTTCTFTYMIIDILIDRATVQEYPTEPLLRLSPPRPEILLAGNLNRELKSWLGIYPKRFSYCDYCLNVVPGWKQQLSLPL